jgi:hypothetical protein
VCESERRAVKIRHERGRKLARTRSGQLDSTQEITRGRFGRCDNRLTLRERLAVERRRECRIRFRHRW